MLTLTDVSKSFDGVPVLKSVSLSVGEGRTSILIGPSGCGKSTLLRLIIGLIKQDSGTITIDGEPLTQETVGRARHRTGYVIQEGGLFPHLTANRNISLLAGHIGWSMDRIRHRVSELAQLFRLAEGLLERYPYELSGGQRQRVALMRAMMLDPDLLILDEPLGALDPMIRFELQQELRSIFDELHKTVLLVTHDMGEAGFLADDIILLRNGEIVQQGSMEDLLNRPSQEFVEQFITAQRRPWQEIDRKVQ